MPGSPVHRARHRQLHGSGDAPGWDRQAGGMPVRSRQGNGRRDTNGIGRAHHISQLLRAVQYTLVSVLIWFRGRCFTRRHHHRRPCRSRRRDDAFLFNLGSGVVVGPADANDVLETQLLNSYSILSDFHGVPVLLRVEEVRIHFGSVLG